MGESSLDRREFELDNLILRLDLKVPGTIEAIGPAVDQILKVVGQMGCAEGSEFEIEVALQEALANAVKHGCREDPDKEVEIAVGCDEERGMLIVVRDPGEGFDFEQLPSPCQSERLYFDHGRGVYLINELMDEVRYERNGTEIWMRKS